MNYAKLILPTFVLFILLDLYADNKSTKAQPEVLEQLEYMEGKKLYDFPTLVNKAAFVSKNPLPSGNVEYCLGDQSSGCSRILEVDPKTNLIVKARFADDRWTK